MRVIRQKGFTATRIEDVCAEAGLTKGSFFHHFAGKDDLALAAAAHWDAETGALFAQADYQALGDPLDRLLAYLDFRVALLAGELCDTTCLLGTMVQDTYATHPELRAACDTYIRRHAATVTAIIADAKRAHAPHARWNPESLSMHIQAALQGAFVLAKASGAPGVAVDSLRHLRRYVASLFDAPGRAAAAPSRTLRKPRAAH